MLKLIEARLALVPLLLFMCMGQGWANSGLDTLKQKPNLFLLKTYQPAKHDKHIVGWVMSEKLDGIRAFWTGKQLRTRSGVLINAPNWFLDGLPPFAIDGELWTTQNDFEQIVSIVRQKKPDNRWHQITYQIFEVPTSKPNQALGHQARLFLNRLAVLKAYLVQNPSPFIKIIPQVRINTISDVTVFLNKVLAKKGEGVVVRNPNLPYQTGRLSSALKVKKYTDAECQVTGYLPGKGQFVGMVGALRCDVLNGKAKGKAIKVGSGLTRVERQTPPKIGATITFKYYGLTKKGNPRFPIFIRVRR